MGHWYDDQAFVRRVQINVGWFFRAYHLPPRRIVVDGHNRAALKQAIKDAKFYLGYLRPFIYWGGGVDETFIQRLHHPSYRLSRFAVRRGIARRRAAAPTPNLATVEGCARWILNSHVRFWTGLSTGSERVKFEQLAAHGTAYCNHTGRNVRVRLNLLQFLVGAIQTTPTQINALTGGDHPYEDSHPDDPRHYADPCEAVDIDLSLGSTAQREAIARRHGGARNSEQSHEHYDFDPAKVS